MDTLRGNFADRADDVGTRGYDANDDANDFGGEAPPLVIDADERRMQVRAYNHWAGLLEARNFPLIDDLEPANLPDFGPYSVLLDFSGGIDNPGIAYLGDKLALECGADGGFKTLADVPPRSLLSRITDHYMQILANQAPIGFEAEFVNQRGATILYRGILLPFSSDDDTIDFIYGVINWKEMADSATADALLLEIDQAIGEEEPAEPDADAWADDIAPRTDDTMAEWADGPAADLDADLANSYAEPDDVLDLTDEAEETEDYEDSEDDSDEDSDEDSDGVAEPASEVARPRFGSLLDLAYSAPSAPDAFGDSDDEDEYGDSEDVGSDGFASIASVLPSAVPQPEADTLAAAAMVADSDDMNPTDMNLADWLAAAREFAEEARYGEERTRDALYEAIGRAYDFSLAAASDPEGFSELLADAGLPMQDRAPLTPVVKLVFGFDYDKTRLTEYAAALTHAHRLALPQGTLAAFIRDSEGGLKGVVQAERALRRAQGGKAVVETDGPRARIAKKLRAVAPQGFDAIPAEGPEFALVMLRRLPGGAVVVVGEVPEDAALVERAAKKLLA